MSLIKRIKKSSILLARFIALLLVCGCTLPPIPQDLTSKEEIDRKIIVEFQKGKKYLSNIKNDLAEESFFRSLNLLNKYESFFEETKKNQLLKSIYLSLGKTYEEKGDLISSIQYYKKALNIDNSDLSVESLILRQEIILKNDKSRIRNLIDVYNSTQNQEAKKQLLSDIISLYFIFGEYETSNQYLDIFSAHFPNESIPSYFKLGDFSSICKMYDANVYDLTKLTIEDYNYIILSQILNRDYSSAFELINNKLSISTLSDIDRQNFKRLLLFLNVTEYLESNTGANENSFNTKEAKFIVSSILESNPDFCDKDKLSPENFKLIPFNFKVLTFNDFKVRNAVENICNNVK